MRSGVSRWWALTVLCLGSLMIVLDTTIVNVALPSIRADLHFTETSLVWVVNAYMLTYAGFLLLGGRLGDLYGHRRVFLAGLVLFTLASLSCGLAHSQAALITARAIQGLGGAVVSAVALSLIVTMFVEPEERARAMGFFGFIAAGGGAIGVFLGGVLTGALDWHWVFLVNVPIGIAVYIGSLFLVPRTHGPQGKLDVGGAVLITAALVLAMCALIGGNEAGWLSAQTVGFLFCSFALFCAFVFLEQRVAHPLMPLSLFRKRTIVLTSIIGILWSAAMFTWFFLSALYMQLLLHYEPLMVGLAFLPGNIIMGVFSVGLSARIVDRFGPRRPLILGMGLIALGLALYAVAPQDGTFLLSILPPTIALGFGAGLAFNPVLLIGMSEVPPDESGLASGVLNTAFMMGGSLGLAVLASVAAFYAHAHLALGEMPALLAGYHVAFAVGALAGLGAMAVAFMLPRTRA